MWSSQTGTWPAVVTSWLSTAEADRLAGSNDSRAPSNQIAAQARGNHDATGSSRASGADPVPRVGQAARARTAYSAAAPGAAGE